MVKNMCDIFNVAEQCAPTAASVLATSHEPPRQQFGARSRWRHADADCGRVSVLSYFMSAKIKMDLNYVKLNDYC